MNHGNATIMGSAIVQYSIRTTVYPRIALSVVGNREIAEVDRFRRHVRALWRDERAISSVEYAMLLAFIGGGIIAAADLLSNAVMNELSETAVLLDGVGCGNDGGGNGTGGAGGTGQGGANTC